jgi:hypothetical protein
MTRKADTKQADAIAKEFGLDRYQRRMLHDAITKQGFTYQEIRQKAEEIRQDHPGKRHRWK